MNDTLIDRYRRWFDYEKDSHAKTLESLNKVAHELRPSKEFCKAVNLMGHIIAAARRVWLFRFGVLKNNVELFPPETNLADLPRQISEMETLWFQYLDELYTVLMPVLVYSRTKLYVITPETFIGCWSSSVGEKRAPNAAR
jgi:hypothetical protein